GHADRSLSLHHLLPRDDPAERGGVSSSRPAPAGAAQPPPRGRPGLAGRLQRRRRRADLALRLPRIRVGHADEHAQIFAVERRLRLRRRRDRLPRPSVRLPGAIELPERGERLSQLEVGQRPGGPVLRHLLKHPDRFCHVTRRPVLAGRPWRIAMVASFRWALPLPGEIVSAFLSICDASLTRFMASSVLPSLVNAVELRGFKRSASLSSRSASRQSFRIIATDPRISWA